MIVCSTTSGSIAFGKIGMIGKIVNEMTGLDLKTTAVSSNGAPHNHCIGTAAGKTFYRIPNQHEMGNIPPNLGSGWPRKSDKTWFMT